MSNTKLNINTYKEIKNKAFETYNILNKIPIKNIEETKEDIFIKRSIDKLYDFLNSLEIKNKDFEEIINFLNILEENCFYDYYLTTIEKKYCEREIEKYEENKEIYKIPELDLFIENGEFLKSYIAYRISKIKEMDNDERKLVK